MPEVLLMLSVFVIVFLIGYLLISKVPPRLHTPLMSMTNAISGVTVLGALLLFSVESGTLVKGLGALAIASAAFNLVGGFAITNRMLKMFKKRKRSA